MPLRRRFKSAPTDVQPAKGDEGDKRSKRQRLADFFRKRKSSTTSTSRHSPSVCMLTTPAAACPS
jgi:hypothetical protein